MIIECMIGSVGYNDIPKDPLEELFHNIKWESISDKEIRETDHLSDEDDAKRI